MSRHTDIRVTGWIARLPPAMQAYALLARLDRPIGTWLLWLPGCPAILLPLMVRPTGRCLPLPHPPLTLAA